MKSTFHLFKHPVLFRSCNFVLQTNKVDKICNHLYLGNKDASNDMDFLRNENIESVVNCTKDLPFHSYFDIKSRLRLHIDDSRDENNLNEFYPLIRLAVLFIDEQITLDKNVLVHCYWGWMRSATVVGAYLMEKHGMTPHHAKEYIRDRRPYTMMSIYNFDDLLERYYLEYVNIKK